MNKKTLMKKIISVWIYLGIILGLGIIITTRIFTGYSSKPIETIFFVISDIGSCFGLFYVILNNAKLKIALYAGIVLDTSVLIVSIQQKIYLSTLFYSCYAIPTLIIGLIRWNKNKSNDLHIQMTKKTYFMLPVIFLLAYSVALTFSYIVGSNAKVIFLDCAVICCAAVGLFFLSKRNFLQWPAFILGDTLCVIEYAVLAFYDSTMISLLIMTCFFLINDYLGFFNWLEDIKKNKKKDLFYLLTKK